MTHHCRPSRAPASVLNQTPPPVHISVSEDELSVPVENVRLTETPRTVNKNFGQTQLNSLSSTTTFEKAYSGKRGSDQNEASTKTTTDSTKSARLGFVYSTATPSVPAATTTTASAAPVDVNNPAKETFTIDLGKFLQKTNSKKGKKGSGTVELTPGKVGALHSWHSYGK